MMFRDVVGMSNSIVYSCVRDTLTLNTEDDRDGNRADLLCPEYAMSLPEQYLG